MIGWVLMAKKAAWTKPEFYRDPSVWRSWIPWNREHMLATISGPSAEYWRLADEAERLGFGQTVKAHS